MSKMNYNDGNVHMEFYQKDIDKKQIAKQFSEDDSMLYNVLLQLWESDIKTTACKGNDDNSAYISFVIDANSIDFIKNVCDYLYLQNGELSVAFLNRKDYIVI